VAAGGVLGVFVGVMSALCDARRFGGLWLVTVGS